MQQNRYHLQQLNSVVRSYANHHQGQSIQNSEHSVAQITKRETLAFLHLPAPLTYMWCIAKSGKALKSAALDELIERAIDGEDPGAKAHMQVKGMAPLQNLSKETLTTTQSLDKLLKFWVLTE